MLKLAEITMIKKLSFISVFLLCFLTVSAHAQDTQQSSPDENRALNQRVDERIQRLKVSLDSQEIQNLKTNCKSAQDKLSIIEESAAAYSSAQNEKIGSIINNLNRLIGSLEDEGHDAAGIKQDLEAINKQKTNIDKAYENYIAAVNDSANMNCEESPAGFRSSVDDAKEQFTSLADYRKSLKDLIKVDLKETLISLKGSI